VTDRINRCAPAGWSHPMASVAHWLASAPAVGDGWTSAHRGASIQAATQTPRRTDSGYPGPEQTCRAGQPEP